MQTSSKDEKDEMMTQTPIALILNVLGSKRSPHRVYDFSPNDHHSNLTLTHPALSLKAKILERVNAEREKKGRVKVFRLNEEKERIILDGIQSPP